MQAGVSRPFNRGICILRVQVDATISRSSKLFEVSAFASISARKFHYTSISLNFHWCLSGICLKNVAVGSFRSIKTLQQTLSFESGKLLCQLKVGNSFFSFCMFSTLEWPNMESSLWCRLKAYDPIPMHFPDGCPLNFDLTVRFITIRLKK